MSLNYHFGAVIMFEQPPFSDDGFTVIFLKTDF
jgi:hypothetical protein